MSLLSQDLLVALKLVPAKRQYSYAYLAKELDLSPSQAHAAMKRAIQSGLIIQQSRGSYHQAPVVNRQALLEFIIHGLRYVFPAKHGPVVRGMPTAHAALPLSKWIEDDGNPVVWPDQKGKVRGQSIEPLHKSVPAAARRDPALYALLALIDGIRAGRARERKIASREIEKLVLSGAE